MPLSKQQIEEIKEIFNLFDADGSGHISHNEMATVMRAMGLTPSKAQLKEIIKQIDTNNDGSIQWNEFLAMMQEKLEAEKGRNKQDELMKAFRVFDKNGDGFISVKELKHRLTTLGDKMKPEEVDQLLQDADIDNQGRINYAEFASMLCS